MSLLASQCPNGHVTYPEHPLCPTCGEAPISCVDLADKVGRVVTWTVSTATPPGVRSPNAIAIVEFSVDTHPVRTIGQLTTDAIATGDRVRPVFVDTLREPAGIRDAESHSFSGYRYEPV